MPPSNNWLGYDSSVCSVARTLEQVGDRWTVLILRDVFRGVRRFDELQQHLGISRDILARRLRGLVEAGILQRRGYRDERSRERFEYAVTKAGADLTTVLLALLDWGDAHLPVTAGPPAMAKHRDCGGSVHAELHCSHGHRVESSHDVVVEPGPGARRTA
jgi:DNA-binding HxlR family transcriptional regulator